MTFAHYVRLMARESRRSRARFAFFVACLAIGVGAVVAVAGLSAGLERGIRLEARQLLAADLVVSGRAPTPRAATDLLAAQEGSRTANLKELVTVAASAVDPALTQLVELKVIDGAYPFYGNLEMEPQRDLAKLLDPQSAVVAPDLLARLSLTPGDPIRIGGQTFEITGIVYREPDRIGGAFSLGPRVFLSADGLARTELERLGSRILHKTLVQLPESATKSSIQELEEQLEDVLLDQGLFRVETHVDAQPELRRGIRRVERFLGLVALLSLLVGGVGVAQTARSWVAGRMDAIAILRCLGYRPREVLALYLGQAVLLAVAGSLVGVALGVGLQWLIPRFLTGIVPTDLIRLWQPAAIGRGFFLGLGVALIFTAGPLSATGRVPPVRVLRRETDPLPPPLSVRLGLAALLVGGVWATASTQAASFLRGMWFTLGLVAAVAVLSLGARAVMWMARWVPSGRGPLALRHGLGALARPGAGTVGGTVALGLGVLVLVAMTMVQMVLSTQLLTALPPEAPTAFLVDIQPAQWNGVRQILERNATQTIQSMPVVTARLSSVAGTSVADLVAEDPENRDRRWALTREQRLTYLEALPEDNEIVEGALWSLADRDEASVEEEYASELGLEISETLEFDVQGLPVEVVASSIRTVDWQSFSLNFFIVVEPGVLDSAPQYRVAAARLDDDATLLVQGRLARDFPNVTLFDIRTVLEKLERVFRRLGSGVRFLGGFTAITGLLILAGAVSATAVRRGREVALLKTLGVTRPGIISMFLVEFSLLGLLAGIVGTGAGAILAYFVATQGLELDWSLRPWFPPLAILVTVALTILAGLGASWPALRKSPLAVLRRD